MSFPPVPPDYSSWWKQYATCLHSAPKMLWFSLFWAAFDVMCQEKCVGRQSDGLQEQKGLAQGTFSVSDNSLEECLFGKESTSPLNRFNLLTMEHWAYSFKTRTLIWCSTQWCHSLLRGGISILCFPVDVEHWRRTSACFQVTPEEQ